MRTVDAVNAIRLDPRRLLVVEDSAADAELIADCFHAPTGPEPFHLTHAQRLDAAIARLSRTAFDCVLLDLSLPDSKGLDSVRRIRAAAADVPIVVLTGLNDPSAGEHAVRLGAQDFLLKQELSAHTLSRSVRYAIERHRQQAAVRLADATVLEAKARFQRAFDSAPIGMALVGLNGRFMEVNAALLEMTGYPEPQLLAANLRDTVHAEDLEAFDLAFDGLVAGDLVTFRAECRLIGFDDRLAWALVSMAVVDDTEGRAAHLIVHAEDITARKAAEARLIHETLHDPLTGLANRILVQDRIAHALARRDRRSESIGVFYVDIDRFKLINDTLGHAHGDEVLVEVGRRLSGVLRSCDTVARLGGDEFVLLAVDLSGRDEAASIADRLRAAVTTPFRLGDTEIVPSVSIGVALAGDRHRKPEQLLREADCAMYQAKERGKARFEIFDDALRASANHRLATETLIRRAVAEDRLAVVYQPVIDLTTSRVVGFEALMRVDDPDQGLLAPSEFLATAEDTGLIVPMDRWVLTKAVEQTARWLGGWKGAPLKVNVNVSARQVALPGLTEDIALILAAHAVAPHHLCLELTETVLIDAADSTLRSLVSLRELGVGLGTDDFGTGYSSLTYLRRFPVDFVKIDKSFVAGAPDNADDVAIIKAVIGLGHALGLTTIAEGVETAAQLELLRALECDQAQGYLLGVPQLPDALAHLLGDSS